MIEKTSRQTALTLAVFALAALMLFGGLGVLPLMQPDEGRNAEVGREMFESGSWLVPTLLGNAYLDKPAFFFKSVALCFSAFGVSEASARLTSAVSGFGVLVLGWLFARRFFGTRAAALFVAVAATCPLFFLFARIVIMDMTLALFVVGAIFCGALAEEYEGRRRLGWLTLGAACAGLGVCVKGPVGFFLPVLVLAVWHFVERRPRAVLGVFHPLPFVVFWLVALAWFVPLCMERPDFLRYGLVEETLNRVATNSTHREKPWHFYLVIAPVGLLVWTVLAPGGLVAAWRARGALSRWDRFCLSWLLTVVIFFSLPTTKQPGYILTCVIPFALLVARLFERALAEPGGRAARVVRGSTFAASVLLPLAGIGMLVLPEPVLAKIFDTSAARMAIMHPLLRPVGVALCVLGISGLVAARRGSAGAAFGFFALLLPAVLLPNLGSVSAYAGSRSMRDLARALPSVPRDTEVVALRIQPTGLAFYLGREITFMTDDVGDLGSNYILHSHRQTNATRNIVDSATMRSWFGSRTNAVLVVAHGHRAEEALAPLVAERGAVLHTNVAKYAYVLLPARGGSKP